MREYIRTLTLAEDFVAISSQVATMVLNTNLIVLLFYAQSVSFELGTPKRCFQDQVRRLLTPTTAVYLGVSVYGAVSQMGLVVYEFVRYNYEEIKWGIHALEPNPPHDFQTFFWLGSFSLNYLPISSVPILFLALERCLTLTHDSWDADEERNDRLQSRFAMASLCVIFFIYVACAMTLMVELPLEEDKIQRCIIFACTLLRLRSLPQVLTKACFTSLNVIVGLLFYRIVRQCSSFKDLNNMAVGVVLVAEFVFSTCIAIANVVINLATGKPSGNFVGLLTTMCIAVENAFITMFYTYLTVSKRESRRDSE